MHIGAQKHRTRERGEGAALARRPLTTKYFRRLRRLPLLDWQVKRSLINTSAAMLPPATARSTNDCLKRGDARDTNSHF